MLKSVTLTSAILLKFKVNRYQKQVITKKMTKISLIYNNYFLILIKIYSYQLNIFNYEKKPSKRRNFL